MDENELREQAWIGDAVLALFAREWILQQPDIPVGERAEVFKSLTSNQFLAALGQPTRMEAEIGAVYASDGLSSAFSFIEGKFIPVFKKQRQNRIRQGSWRDKRGA